MFAERYRLKFATSDESEKDEGSIIIDTDTEDDDEYENAVEDIEIDQSSELYKTIVAAIIENDDDQFGDLIQRHNLKKTVHHPTQN